MKKMTSVFLLVILLFTGTAFANTQATGGENLFKYGFIRGYPGGGLGEENALTRAQASVLLAEMYGERDASDRYRPSSLDRFSDVKENDWFYSNVGFAKHKGWIHGYPDGTFKPGDTISAHEWASMLTNALGHPMNWPTVQEDLLTLGVMIDAKDRAALTRGEAFDAMWQAVNIPRFGQVIPLGVELGRLEREPEPPQAPRLSAGVINSLKQIVLTTNRPLDEGTVTNLENYKVSTDGIYDLEVVNASYNQIEGKVVLTLSQPVLQQSDIKLTVKNILSAEGGKLEELTLNVNMLDVIPPEVKNVQVIGNRAIKVFFSEPIKSLDEAKGIFGSTEVPKLANDAFSLNNGSVIIREITLHNNQMEAIIETFQDLPAKTTVRAQAGVRDYFDFVASATPWEVAAINDKTAPTIVGYENASPTGVTLVWDKDIRILNSAQTSYYHGTNVNFVDGAVTTRHIDGNKLRLHFTRNLLSSGTNSVIVAANAIIDYSGNRNTTQQIIVQLEPDTDPPYVVGSIVPLTEKRIRINFSEHVMNRNGEAQSRQNFKLYDEAGKDVSNLIASIVYRAEQTAVEIDFTKELSGNFTVEVSNIKDFSNNVMVTTSHAFEMKDLTPPNPKNWQARVYNTGRSNQMIKIRFDEPMLLEGNHGILDPQKYAVNGKGLDTLDPSLLRLEVADQGASLLIYYPGSIVRGGYDFSHEVTNPRVEIARVADAYRNYIPEFSVVVKLEGRGFLNVESVAQVDRDKVEVIVSDVLVNVNLSDFHFEGNGKTYRAISHSYENLDNRKTKLVMTLSEPVLGNPSQVSLRIVSTGSSNQYGETLNPQMASMSLEDKMAPFVQKTSFEGALLDHVTYTRASGIVEIRFSETIDPRTVSLLSFEVANYGIDDITVNDRTIQIRISSADRDRVGLYDSVVQRVEIRDLAGNGVRDLNLQIQRLY